ncbi:HdeD family acid-resistance protein [Actinocorallia sp. A-T 12471]|uniref:HdeD family acid-resistance protein n=1 Tax=Actinocorallia sp. A-T 12471 TaxID=3089813 RepID=UPI0029CD6687|nr:HdeD family acid-resistance protein [Actinocorallia sp. A-T 12471]MDX6744285.1 HdeD family acid-resistance protein [Actinocorallia sp. A-T 12471]
MIETIARHWWLVLLRGVIAVLFGVIAWVWPGITVLALAILFGAYALVDGITALYYAIKGVPGQSRGWLAFTGVLGVLAGLIALFWPAITAFVLLIVIACWAIVTGVFEIIAGVWLRRQIDGEWWYIVGGVLSVVFGLLLLIWPGAGGLALIWIIGLFSILVGLALIFASFRLRSLRGPGELPPGPPPATAF